MFVRCQRFSKQDRLKIITECDSKSVSDCKNNGRWNRKTTGKFNLAFIMHAVLVELNLYGIPVPDITGKLN